MSELTIGDLYRMPLPELRRLLEAWRGRLQRARVTGNLREKDHCVMVIRRVKLALRERTGERLPI